MIPKLYDSDRIKPHQDQLVATLAETISCTITEELNGMYELVLQYPTNGKHFDDLMNGGLLLAQHPYRATNTSSYMSKANEPFDIYKQEIDNDILTVYAHHASYRLGGSILTDINVPAGSASSQLWSKIGIYGYYPVLTLSTPFVSDTIKSIREYLLDSEYSITSVYGWEFYFDGHTENYVRVNAYTHRGGDFGVQLRVGKNITSAYADKDTSDSFNALVPFWEKDGVRVLALTSINPPSHTVQPTTPITPVKAIPMDFTESFNSAPTQAQLETAARDYLDTNEPWKPTETAEIGFYPIWETSTFTNTAYIEGVALGDDVTVFWSEGGLNGTKLRAVKTTYDVLLERFAEIQLGTLEKGFVVTSDGQISAVSSSGGGGGVPAIYLTSVPCSAMTGNFVDYNDAAITADYVVAECVFASPSAITTDVSWTTSAGNIKLNGTCSAATTCNLVLVSQ